MKAQRTRQGTAGTGDALRPPIALCCLLLLQGRRPVLLRGLRLLPAEARPAAAWSRPTAARRPPSSGIPGAGTAAAVLLTARPSRPAALRRRPHPASAFEEDSVLHIPSAINTSCSSSLPSRCLAGMQRRGMHSLSHGRQWTARSLLPQLDKQAKVQACGRSDFQTQVSSNLC